MKKRIEYFDGLKGICMILIILGHMLPSAHDNIFLTWSNVFKVSLFYFISGYLFFSSKPKPVVQTLKRTTRTLIFPYFFFSLIFSIFDIILVRGDFHKVLKPDLINTFTLRGIGTLWFLPTIFFAMIIASFFRTHMKYVYLTTIASLFLFLFIETLSFSNIVISNLFLVVGKSAFAYFNFSLAAIIKPVIDRFNKNLQLLLASFMILASFPLALLNLDVDLNNYSLGKSAILFSCASICALIGVFIIFKLFYSSLNRNIRIFINFIGENSLIAMIVHYYPSLVLMKGLSYFSFNGPLAFIVTVISFTILLVITSICILLINRTNLSFLFGKRVTTMRITYLSKTYFKRFKKS